MTIRADVVVVGLGLVGSAATRHLAVAGVDVIGVGPGEPDDWANHEGPYSSHYDSGRVTRRLDARKEWAILASRSIEQYSEIERSSGIAFHHPTGLVFVRNDAAGIASQRRVIADLGLDVLVSEVDDHGVAPDTPEYSFPPGWATLAESGPAGFINPREMTEAQLAAAEKSGARISRETVLSIAKDGDEWLVGTSGENIRAADVVLATGPYLQDLHGRQMQASVRPEAVIIGYISDAEAERVAGMPSAIYLLEHPEIDDTYFVPPVRYPNGRFAIKMGGSNSAATTLTSVEQKTAWMSGKDAENLLGVMTDILTNVLPNVAFDGFEMKPCLITDTPSGLPYVDKIDAGLFIAAGGNGHAAKSADAIGALAAGLVLNGGAWADTELAQSDFSARYGSWTPPRGSRHGN